MKVFLSTTILLIFLAIIGCKDDETGGTTPSFDRKAMLKDLADNVIIPTYADVNAKVVAMDEALGLFIQDPSIETLTTAKARYSEAYHSWQRVGFWEFGPAFDVLLNGSVNSFPADWININNNISSGSYDFNSLSGQDEKGFPTIDYLLYGDTDEGIVDMFTIDANAQGRKDYLLAVADDLTTRIGTVNNAWSPAGGNYRQTFIDKDGTDVGSSVGLMVNELNKFVERETRDKKIGIPLGKRSNGITLPANVEAGYSDMSISLATENLDGLYDFFMGKGPTADGQSFYEYLETIKAQYNGGLLADAIKNQFEKCLLEVAEIPSPYDESLQTNSEPANEAHAELQKLVVLLKADMPSALAILISYQDNDGD